VIGSNGKKEFIEKDGKFAMTQISQPVLNLQRC
jgi:hypothetical protein